MTSLEIYSLGPFQVKLDGEIVTEFGSDTARALLAYLVMHPGIVLLREVLAGLLWPEYPNTNALRNLRVALSRLRDAINDRTADPSYFNITRQSIQLNTESRYWLDVHEMETGLMATKMHIHDHIETCGECALELQKVADLYRGEFLAGFTLDSAPFEEWLVVEQERVHWLVLDALENLTSYYLNTENFEAAMNCARRQVELEPWREAAYRQWMRALALNGQRGAAISQYEICRKILADELGMAPENQTIALYEQIKKGILSPSRQIHFEYANDVTKEALLNHPTQIEIPVTPQIQVALNAPTHMPVSERRSVTIMHMELMRTGDLHGKASAENWAEVISQLQHIASTVVERYGGVVDRYDESGFVALFGAYIVHEDDPERGTLAAMDTLKLLQAQIAHLHEQGLGSDNVDVRIGVHTGDVIVTLFDGEGMIGHHTVLGDAIQRAHHMLKDIPYGEVAVSEETYGLLSQLFEWEPAEDVKLYSPLRRQIVIDKGRGIPGMQSILVGREDEKRMLEEALEQLHSGIGNMITLVGEAGIGKSRLVAEVRKLSRIKWVEGRCLSYSETMAYGLWQSILRDLLGVTVDTPAAVSRYALRQQMPELGAEIAELYFSSLLRLLAIPLEVKADVKLQKIDAETLIHVTINATELLLESVARRQPLVIVCEDLHWADSISLSLLEHLLVLTDRVPILFICVLRPRREHGSWQLREKVLREYPLRHIDIQLEPLTAMAGDTLLENLLLSLPTADGRKPVVGLPARLKKQIYDRCEGNPFFIEEILRALILHGIIECDTDACQWQAEADANVDSIPASLYGVLQSRISQLPSGTRNILQIASVIGQIFPYALLAEITDRDLLDAHLVTLQREQMIREHVRLPDREYIFQHQLTMEAVYNGLLHRVRRVLHRRVAQALEKVYAQRIGEQMGRLAYHWEQAGETEKAGHYL